MASALFAALAAARFLSPPGAVNSSSVFAFLPIAAQYLEPENTTSAPGGWGQGGSFPYLFDVTSVPPSNASCGALGPPQPNMDRPGGDLLTIVQTVDDASLCAASCCDEAACGAWAYAARAPAPYLSCAAGDHCCYLKAGQPAASPLAGLTSGLVNRSAVTGAQAPPPGMRSAVPLGGLGAGAMELRGDGTFHEVTIQNQSPAGAAKWGTLGDMLLAASAGGDARAVRTAPPPYARGLAQLTYSGSYPLSRLAVNDASFAGGAAAAVFAYSALVPGDSQASAAPAISFTLAATNGGAAAANFSWFLSLPLAAVNDCARPSKSPAGSSTVASYGDCLAACAAAPACASWTWAQGSGLCSLAADVPLTRYAAGSRCGVAGAWSSSGRALTLTAAPAGGAGGPANGDVTLQPVLGGGGAAAASASASFAVGNDPAALYADWAAHGGFSGAQVFNGVAAAHGAAAVTATLAPGESVALTIVFAWYFADRDHMGVNVGNWYSNLWEHSAAVAAEVATADKQLAIVSALNAHHAVFADSSLPAWIADNAINHMSHFRGFIWTRDGRMREFEANDCPDVDSIHNDFQRHLPYLWVVPEFDISKMRKWASGQAACGGCIYEYLGSFGLGPLDVPGGRIMGDTTTLFVVEVLEYWIGTGDESLLAEFWPNVKIAVDWAIKQAGPDVLPTHLVCTYDILDLDRYNHTTYNSFLFLAMLEAASAMGAHLNDAAFVAQAQAAAAAARASMQRLLWNSTYSYWRAYTGGDAVMSDSLYGAEVAHHNGLGLLWPTPADLVAHLAAEEKYNYDAGGLKTITGRHTPPPAGAAAGPDTQDDVIWEQAGPTWSYMALALGSESTLDAALAPAVRGSDKWRSKLNDAWNVAGIASGDDWPEGQRNLPFVTSHYGFLLVDYYLVPGLSGQQHHLGKGAASFLSFNPPFAPACPFTFPVLLPGTTGSVGCDAAGAFNLSLAFGALSLPAGGLSVNGHAYPAALELAAGDSVSWQ